MTRFDLHIHTALSTCAEDVMSPLQVVTRAAAAGLNMIAITDHNASANVPPAIIAGERLGVRVVPGVEVATREDIHLLAYFGTIQDLGKFQEVVDANLPGEKNVPELFGNQLVYDENDEIIDLDERLRGIGINLGLDETAEEIARHSGKIVAAHLYRPKFSVFSQLGFISPGSRFDAVEIQYKMWHQKNMKIGEKVEGFPAITGSDSHYLDSVGRVFNEIPETAQGLEDLFRILKK